jgi:hypothetical protein
MSAEVGLDQLDWLPEVTLAVAISAWAAASLGLIAQGARRSLRAVNPAGAAG